MLLGTLLRCRSSFQAMGRQEKFIERNRKIAHTLSGRVIKRVSNCCGARSWTRTF